MLAFVLSHYYDLIIQEEMYETEIHHKYSLRCSKCVKQPSSNKQPIPILPILQDCKCCRESRLVDKMVTLTSCYDGNQLIPGQAVSLLVKDPVECQCFDCAI